MYQPYRLIHIEWRISPLLTCDRYYIGMTRQQNTGLARVGRRLERDCMRGCGPPIKPAGVRAVKFAIIWQVFKCAIDRHIEMSRSLLNVTAATQEEIYERRASWDKPRLKLTARNSL
jgi:hypothetical protein